MPYTFHFSGSHLCLCSSARRRCKGLPPWRSVAPDIKGLKGFVGLGPLSPQHVHACKGQGLGAVADAGLGHAVNSDDPTVLVVDDDGAGVELHFVCSGLRVAM